ncbi:MAG: tetratricopeptide repeat protein [Microcystis sp. M038S2]|uniref:tetratricopeptide repeat protein n=1 Tax=unclassified Microcystis TaxID=2643300 RepID=UPI001DD5A52D|nr:MULTISPECIES: tetratricopeptide repeat protein [unclassified Microcystis]NCQ70035.1 tetratricopeptide repeat protein [Microcystis aeruginosa W13-16]NCQ74555.1 tetratricopeptide repeat protein [Microcystis aeruginosa W13-13]NCQ79016.1 tetratricopeptide repeat protein [Microcystis aeruginosa W13-15]NCR22836.1 tetratricopeptide repeat protein [Microcystis aeruginosa L111-01]NCS44535.1 tetratricopeptide repeat protein [Microcystis aeruginosa BS11-05]
MLRFSLSLWLCLIGTSLPLLAQTETPAPNPLETPLKSPLLPGIDRPLTPLERRQLLLYIDRRDAEAQAKYDAGLNEEAFPIWYEVIKLNRYLGAKEEVKSLGKVGLAAWNRDRTEDVKLITNRLKAVQQTAETNQTIDGELLALLGTSYEQVRAFNEAIIIYDKIIANARKSGDNVAVEATLNKLGQIHLSRFDYQKAAPVYEELLTISKTQNNSLTQGIYLQRLAEIYRESLQPANAVKIKEEIAETQIRNQQIQLIPALKIQIGLDYQALKDANKASQNFQEAYSLAFALQQYGIAGEALNKLAELYKSYQQVDYALQIYQELIKVHELGYNYYGLMNTYDQIGQIYLERKNYPQALLAFQKGAELAQAIRYREQYFQTQITQVNQAINNPEQF